MLEKSSCSLEYLEQSMSCKDVFAKFGEGGEATGSY